jgi:hypothetical protein
MPSRTFRRAPDRALHSDFRVAQCGTAIFRSRRQRSRAGYMDARNLEILREQICSCQTCAKASLITANLEPHRICRSLAKGAVGR